MVYCDHCDLPVSGGVISGGEGPGVLSTAVVAETLDGETGGQDDQHHLLPLYAGPLPHGSRQGHDDPRPPAAHGDFRQLRMPVLLRTRATLCTPARLRWTEH